MMGNNDKFLLRTIVPAHQLSSIRTIRLIRLIRGRLRIRRRRVFSLPTGEGRGGAVELFLLLIQFLVPVCIHAHTNQHTEAHALSRQPRRVGRLFDGQAEARHQSHNEIADVVNLIDSHQPSFPENDEENDAHEAELCHGGVEGVADESTCSIKSPYMV